MAEPELNDGGEVEVQEEFSLEDHLGQAEEVEEEQQEEASYLDGIPPEDLKFAKGWNPEFQGEEAKTLKQFIADGKMMDKIDYLKVGESHSNLKISNSKTLQKSLINQVFQCHLQN